MERTRWGRPRYRFIMSPSRVENTLWNSVGLNPGLGLVSDVFITTRPVIVPGRRSWINEMLELAGGINPFADRDAESLEVSAREAIAAAPEAVVMSWCGVQEQKYRPHIVARREGWEDVPAIRNGRIVPISEAWLGRPGPRLLDGIERLREVVEACRRPD